MHKERFTRREILQKRAAFGSVTVLPSLSLTEMLHTWEEQEHERRSPTPWCELGPFYKACASDRKAAPGGRSWIPLNVSGQVFNERG
jgi:hypothetical protein